MGGGGGKTVEMTYKIHVCNGRRGKERVVLKSLQKNEGEEKLEQRGGGASGFRGTTILRGKVREMVKGLFCFLDANWYLKTN